MHLPIITTRIYFDDTDAAGVVYHGNYLKIFERARSDQFLSLGFDHTGYYMNYDECFVVADIHIKYKVPVRLADEVSIETYVNDVGSARVNIRQTMQLNGKTVTEMDTVLVWVGGDGRPEKIPDDILNMMKELKVG